MSDALKRYPLLLPLVKPGSTKRKEVSSAAEDGQSDAESTSKKARRERNDSPVACSSLSPEEFDHEDMGKGTEPVTGEPHPEDAEAELSASVGSYSLNFKIKGSIRTAPKGLDCTYLCVFQTYAYD